VANSTAKPRKKRPANKFPLSQHSSGQWRKKVLGKDHYFGTDRDAALTEWLRVKDDLIAGRTPTPVAVNACTLMALANQFLTNAKSKRDNGEITNRTFDDYHKSCERILKQLGKSVAVEELRPDNLMRLRRALAETLNPTSLGNEVGRIRVILRFAFENGLTDRPIRFGDFKRPAKRVMRRAQAKAGSKLFEAAVIQELLRKADVQLHAMILLGVNCGFGNADCGQLPVGALDLTAGWIDFPRPKTGINRRCPIWPETVKSLEKALAARKSATDALVFRTRFGRPWFHDSSQDALSTEFRKLCKASDVYESGKGFYGLRHTFQTIGDEIGDYLATRAIMGHADNTISGTYRERIKDERFQAVTDHVRSWLFPSEQD
jgi:integrase